MLRYAKAIADLIHKVSAESSAVFLSMYCQGKLKNSEITPASVYCQHTKHLNFEGWVNIEILTSNLTYFWWIVTQNHICVHGFPQVLRTWVRRGAPRNLMGGVLNSKHGGAWGELNMLSKNTCEGVNLIVKLPPISLQDSKCTKNKLLHTYFSRILARF